MWTLKEIKALELGQIRVEKNLNMNTVSYSVIVNSFDNNKAIELLLKETPKGFEWLYKNIEFKPYRIIARDFDKRFGILPVFKYRGEFCLVNHKDKGIFAIHPSLPYIAVNNDGTMVYNLKESMFARIIENSGGYFYKTVVIKNGKHYINRTLHRLVAEVWVPNDDYVIKYIVDHIDRNKLNNAVSNLRWVSQNVNTGRHSENNDNHLDYRYGLMNVENGKIYYFETLSKLGDFLGLDKRLLNAKPMPFYIEVKGNGFIVEDLNKFTNWSLMKDLNKYKYQYKVVTPENEVMYFRSWRDIAKKFGIAVNSIVKVGGNLFEVLKKRLKTIGVKASYIGKVKTYNQFTGDKYKIEAKDLDTGEVIVANSTREMIVKLGGKPSNKSVVIIRLNGNKREGVPLEINGKRYLIRRSDKPWPIIVNKTNKSQPIKHVPTGRVFKSLREAERETGRSRGYISNCVINPMCNEFVRI